MQHDAAHLALFMTHRAALVDYAAPIVGCRARAEDIVQEAYIRFSTAAHGPGARIAHPASYLYRIVRNLAVDWVRHLAVEGPRAAPGTLEALPAAAPSPERAALDRDAVRRVAAALDELPERTRRAFELHRLSGLTLQAVAARLGISLSLAHLLVRDAMTHCAERLGDHDR